MINIAVMLFGLLIGLVFIAIGVKYFNEASRRRSTYGAKAFIEDAASFVAAPASVGAGKLGRSFFTPVAFIILGLSIVITLAMAAFESFNN
jgi:hypothetical protein